MKSGNIIYRFRDMRCRLLLKHGNEAKYCSLLAIEVIVAVYQTDNLLGNFNRCTYSCNEMASDVIVHSPTVTRQFVF